MQIDTHCHFEVKLDKYRTAYVGTGKVQKAKKSLGRYPKMTKNSTIW